MGYIRITDFSEKIWDDSYIRDDPPHRFRVYLSEWEEYFDKIPGRERVTCLKFDPVFLDFEQNSVSFSTGKTYVFAGRDVYGVPFNYPFLKLTYLLKDAANNVNNPVLPQDFTFSFAVYMDSKLVQEWFMPVKTTSVYLSLLFPLDRAMAAGDTMFNRWEINILKHPQDMSALYLGELFLFQDEAAHNTMNFLQDLLHNKGSYYVTKLAKDAEPGSDTLWLEDSADLTQDCALTIGRPDGDHELHNIVKLEHYADRTGNALAAAVTGDEFDVKVRQFWPSGTPVYKAFPCITRPLKEGTAVFSVYYLSVGLPQPEPSRSYLAGYEVFAYIRDRYGGNHLMAVRKPTEVARMSVSVNIFSPSREEAEIMWREVRKEIDNTNIFIIAGTQTEYDLTGDGDNTENEDLFHYTRDLEFFIDENVHSYNYYSFPAVKNLTILISSVGLTSGSVSTVNGTPVIINY